MSIPARRSHVRARLGAFGCLAALLVSPGGAGARVLDLATVSLETGRLLRAAGSTGDGSFGLPVAGGNDVDGDGLPDFAFAAMRADPLGRTGAGQIHLLLGTGQISGLRDTAVAQADALLFVGAGPAEATGSELWMDDVTGDGLGDLLIARQNFSPAPDRIGAGALTIVPGAPALRAAAETLLPVDLAAPPAELAMTTIVGANAFDRLGIWMRTGDVTGDGVADLVVGADQVSESGEVHRGAVYVIRGGPHLAGAGSIDLADFGTTALPGHIVRIEPPPGSAHAHFGATVQIADLDANGRSEVLVAAALSRAGAALPAAGAAAGTAHANGGTLDGTLHILWDDNFAEPWPEALDFAVSAAPGSHTEIDGATCHRRFGEEILGGLDYDGDGRADLFVGDLTADCAAESRPLAGAGMILFDVATLRGLHFDLDAPPPGLATTSFFGASAGDLAGDTALHGDFDGDGRADLAFSSPHAAPLARESAGELYVFFGGTKPWPATVDLASLPAADTLRSLRIFGAHGAAPGDAGDTLAYSAAAGDLDGDGADDLIVNEMTGNGTAPAAIDVGNLLVIALPEPLAGAAGALALAQLAALAALAAARRTRRPGINSAPKHPRRARRSAHCAARAPRAPPVTHPGSRRSIRRRAL